MLKNSKKRLAKTLMKLWPARPDPNDLSLWEVFNRNEYRQGAAEYQRQLKLDSARFRFEYEKEICFFKKYFPTEVMTRFKAKRIFDLGCFTGGRAVYWAESYGFGEIFGIDINPIFAQAGKLFAAEKNVTAHFLVGTGESLPLASESFDAIISYDVIEHVRDVENVFNECFRILKPGGKIFLVFPTIFQPLESHLGCATKFPGLNCLFSGQVLNEAYQEILEERGSDAYWYRREKPELENWEKLPSLNGITVSRFRRLIRKNTGWQVVSWRRDPLLSSGRLSKKMIFRILRPVFSIPAHLPILEELFLDRICCVLEKRRK